MANNASPSEKNPETTGPANLVPLIPPTDPNLVTWDGIPQPLSRISQWNSLPHGCYLPRRLDRHLPRVGIHRLPELSLDDSGISHRHAIRRPLLG